MRDTLLKAISTYGKDMQIAVAIEEMAELTKELIKIKRGFGSPEAVAEEMADVEIMIEQLKIIFCNPELVDQYKAAKVNRLADRLKDDCNNMEMLLSQITLEQMVDLIYNDDGLLIEGFCDNKCPNRMECNESQALALIDCRTKIKEWLLQKAEREPSCEICNYAYSIDCQGKTGVCENFEPIE